MRALSSSIVVLLQTSVTISVLAQADPSFFKTRSAELRSGGRVTMVALAPGREDVAMAAHYRLILGARVQLAFLTNGESTTYPGAGYPNQVAADLRRRAYELSESLQAEHVFLNLPDIDAARDTMVVRANWDPDTVQARLFRILQSFQPDLVVLNGFERVETPPVVKDEVLSNVQAAVRRLRSGRIWSLPAIAIADLGQRRRSPSTIMKDLDAPYTSLRPWIPISEPNYSTVPGFPRTSLRSVSDPGKLLTVPRPKAIAEEDSMLRSLGQEIGRWKAPPKGKTADRIISRLVQALAHVDLWIQSHPREADPERRILLDKRLALESLRVKLLGIVPYWRVSDSVLTNLQLTYITIDSIRGLDRSGDTQVYFPMVQQQWILNEGNDNKAAFVPGQPYRIISSRNIAYDLPRELNGLERSHYRTPWHFFIVHRASVPERSFSMRLDAGFLGAPRFSADVLTPIVRAIDGESVVIRLTNNSRDGVRDTLSVLEPLVRSTKMYFRMNAKGTVEYDTLRLSFDPDFPWGTHFVSVGVRMDELARFLVRKFDVATSTRHTVAVLARGPGDPTAHAVRSLGVRMRLIDPSSVAAADLSGCDVAVVPEYAFTIVGSGGLEALKGFVSNGGRCVVLQQNPADVSRLPNIADLRATWTGEYDTTAILSLDTLQRVWSTPNKIRSDPWDGWVFRRASLRLHVPDNAAEILATVGSDRSAAVIRWKIGAGVMMYVNLNLGHQLLNVHPTSYQFLANLLAD